ncbi:uncharacterized protein EI97DRAFT_32896 [Westerdykella ornata]|uniref:Cyclin-like protein n=1 Tax=Westerdykella ornata TaxID=318751 RepID=A0A6A6JZ96_WESOR|nr:uncharacterized protein EI97DRAFT_32896 [Westerdykella ornata]KAF2281554.1 hypothetical protein EI97DRAFT_32896 [Westerdykella ornata]
MPSFYPRPSPRQAPITPPEFIPSYQTGCGGMPYQHTQYGRQASIRQQEDGHDFEDRYGQLAMALPPMYPQAGTYMSDALQRNRGGFPAREDMAPTLPPMRSQFGLYGHQTTYQQQYAQESHQRVVQAPKEEKPVGGVSAKLDYDMDVMTDFVCEMAVDIIKPPDRGTPPTFRKWVHQVLCATRLPSATILLSMFYLSQRMTMLRGQPRSESDLYRLLTISLVLGSKFLDDNTFINRSWSEVSRIPVADLNRLETEWLLAIEFRLHRDPTEQNGWNVWSSHWKGYERSATARANRPIKLDPIDTFLASRPTWVNQNKPLPALPTQHSYNLPPPYEPAPKSAQPLSNNAHYEHWRSANDYSPPSAVTTGPPTPEYLGSVGPWAQAEAYSRRTMFGYPPQPQPAPSKHSQHLGWAPASSTPSQHQQHTQHYGWAPSAFSGPYTAPAWGHHGWGVPHDNCHCMGCMQYMRPQVAAG